MDYALKFEDLVSSLNENSKILYVNGCSMTYGQELCGISDWTSPYFNLPPHVPTEYHENRIKASYPYLVRNAVFSDHTLMNDAMCGGSNPRIVRRTMHHVAEMLNRGVKPENIVVFIGFTSMSRLELYDKTAGRFFDLHLTMNYQDEHLKSLSDMYLTRFTDTRSVIQQTMVLISGLESFLKSLGVKYLFSMALGMITNMEQNPSDNPAVYNNALFKLFDSRRWVGWDEKWLMKNGLDWSHTFRNYCLHHRNLPVGPRDHPLEESHQIWSQYIVDHINTNEELFI